MSDDRDSPSSSAFAFGTVLGGKFSITRAIGRGGMGTVYEGQQLSLRRRVAIKTLNPELARNNDLRARFVREGELAARIRHPNVIEVIDVGEHEGTPFLVLEFLEGEDLGQRLGRLGRLSTNECADLLLPVCAAIASAHEMGVVHRDLKPENIFLLTPARGPVIPKVVDFGISKLVDGATKTPSSAKLTAEGAIIGTPLYLAPEVTGGAKQLDAKSDQYTLGVILYECITGQRPFNATNLAELVGEILSGRCERPSALVEGLDPAFEALVVRAMSLDKSKRFGSMWALGRALLPFASERVRSSLSDQFLGGHSVQSERPPAAPEPARSPARTPRQDAATLAETAIDVAARPAATRATGASKATIAVAAALAFSLVVAGATMRARMASGGAATGDAGAAIAHTNSTPTPTPTPTPSLVPTADAESAQRASEDSGVATVEPAAVTHSADAVDAGAARASGGPAAIRRPTASRDAGRRSNGGGNGQGNGGSNSFIE
jgi:serine/threonine protein kinase